MMLYKKLPTTRFSFSVFVGTVLFLLLCSQAIAQTNANTITFSKFTLQQDAKDEANGMSGLRLKFDIAFSWAEEDFFKRTFSMTYRLDENGKTILRCTDPGLYAPSVTPTQQTVKGKPGMVSIGKEVFIPYTAIPLESGPKQLDLYFSLANDEGTYTDCFKTKLIFNHKKIVRHSLNDQVFTFSNIQLDAAAKEFSTSRRALAIAADVNFKYNLEESIEDKYEVCWLIRNAAGKQVFDSRKIGSTGDRTEVLPNELREGKAGAKLSMVASYHDIDLEGPNEAEIVFLLLGTEGGPKEIFSKKMMLDLPYKYNFEEQSFTLKSTSAKATQRDGVQGIEVQYACAFKNTGVMRNEEKGMYYFYAAIFDAAGKVVVAPERASTQGAGTAHLQDGQLPSPENAIASGSLFIPLHMLTVPAGSHALKFGLFVSDKGLQSKFPMVGNGNIAVAKPAEQLYALSLERLDMINADYDTEIIPISSNLPELQYYFAVGEDNYFASEYNRNSLSAIPATATLRLCEGDPINLVLYDVDSGFFNDNDLLGKWKIDYAGKGNSFVYELHDAGQVVALRLKISKVTE